MKNLSNKNPSNSIETEYITMFLEDGILYCIFKEIEVLDIDVAKINVKDRLEFIKGTPYPCFFDISKVKTTTKEARDYIANNGSALVEASALLINSPVMKMMANFYIRVNKPKNPTRMFTDKESALEWLSQFKHKV